MKKVFFLLGLSACAMLQSCDVEDLMTSFTEGETEDYVIVNKTKGTLHVNEPYKAAAVLYEVEDNPFHVSEIEFTADGSYHLTFDSGGGENFSRELSVDVEGRRLRIPFRAATRSGGNASRTTGTYTYQDGRYVLMGDYDWLLENGELKVTENGETQTYQATKVPYSESVNNELTERLCHSWTLSRVLLKLYNADTQKLVFTYHLTEEEVRENCIDTFVFSLSKKFYRYKDGMNNGNGRWDWKVMSEQSMTYWFEFFSFDNPVPVHGSNDLTVYFADNRLYLTENCEALDEYEYYGNDEPMPTNYYKVAKAGKSSDEVHLKAVLLYQLDVKGSN